MSHISLNKFWSTISAVIVGSFVLLMAFSAHAQISWTDPQGQFPYDNTPATINTALSTPEGQIKYGPNNTSTQFNFNSGSGPFDSASIRTDYIWGQKEQVTEDKIIEGKEAWTEVVQEAGDRYGFRYTELNQFLIAALYQELLIK